MMLVQRLKAGPYVVRRFWGDRQQMTRANQSLAETEDAIAMAAHHINIMGNSATRSNPPRLQFILQQGIKIRRALHIHTGKRLIQHQKFTGHHQ